MKKRNSILFILLLVVIIGGIAGLMLRPHEPVYKGKSLSLWLKQLDDGYPVSGLTLVPWGMNYINYTPQQTQAVHAIRQMGTNSLPYLLHAMGREDSALKLKLVQLLSEQSWLEVCVPLASENRRPAALALDALGPAAKPLTPELQKVFNSIRANFDPAFYRDVTIALAAIGPEGWAVLAQEISNTNDWARSCAIWGLASHHATVSPATLASLMAAVTNKAEHGDISAWALGELAQDQEHVIPVLINGLGSSASVIRSASAAALGKFGTNAASAVPALLKTLADTQQTVRSYSSNALKEIDSEAAAKAGVK
jgi:HEAT repeats